MALRYIEEIELVGHSNCRMQGINRGKMSRITPRIWGFWSGIREHTSHAPVLFCFSYFSGRVSQC
jgi:hypothetical protein